MGTVITTDKENRILFKERLLNKVEESLIPPVLELDPEPVQVEIIERYSKGLPLQLEPMEESPPEFKKELPYVPVREISKRGDIKTKLLNKVEESLIPPSFEVESEPVPIEIIEKYAYGLPQQLVGLAEQLDPEVKKILPHIPDREISKRAEIKRSLLNKVEESLIPPAFEVESESASIEIIEKYAHGLPQQLTDPVEQMFPEVKNPVGTFILDSDIPKRKDAKDRLLNKILSLSVETAEITPVDIVGYAQRSVSPFEPEFGEIDRLPTVISDEELQVLPTEITKVEVLIPVLRLPENYNDFDERALYGILIRNPALQHTSDSANLVLDVLSGRSAQPVEFEVINCTPPSEKVVQVEPPAPKRVEIQEQFKPQEAEKRAAFVSGLSSRVESLFEALESDEEVETKYELILQIPDDWDTIPLSVLRTDLLTKGGTPEQVDKLLASLTEKVVEEEIPFVAPMVEELQIDFPESFSNWKPSDQYVYLTRVLKLTPEKANSIMYKETV